MTIKEQLDNKKVLIWGYGREGKSTEAYCKSHCNCSKLDVFEGSYEELPQDSYDIVIKSPGIPLLTENEKISSQTQLFLSQFASQTIGITGTKGKSTTASLLFHVLSDCSERPVLLVGNIGLPCFDSIDQITEDTIIVYELSCHQLHHLTVSPHISVFLNLYEEHLDYYKRFEEYFNAKKNIARFQTADDKFYCGENVPEFPVNSDKKVVPDEKHDFPLLIPGLHNQLNAYFVELIATENFGLKEQAICKSMETFKGLPHRLEFVTTKNGVSYYDDSISTIPEAAINAIKSIPKVQTILLGGMDRGIDYSLLIDYIKETKDVIFLCMYETGKKLYEETKSDNCIYCANLAGAVKKAKECTQTGNACVLSPAAPSYGVFKNFEERGEIFKELVKGGE